MLTRTEDRHHVRLDPSMMAADELAASNAVNADFNSTAAFLIARYGLMLTPDDAAEVIGCSASHVRAMCASGEIPAIKVGQRWRIPAPKLAAFLDGEVICHV